MKIPVDLLQRYEDENPVPVEQIKPKLAEIKVKKQKEKEETAKLIRRRKMISNVAVEDLEDAFERMIGGNQLVAINYLELGLLRSRAVGRLTYFDMGEMKPAVASGFLISPDLVMTNNHVFSAADGFKDAKIEFDYRYDIFGKEQEKVVFELDPGKFFHCNVGLDLCVVGVKPMDVTGKHKITSRGHLVLNGQLGKANEGDFATIIQHPNGHYLQVSLRENEVIDISQETALIYKSDTATGSSGSPVFNDQWQVIALHSAGVAKKNAAGDYLDVDDQVIPRVNGKVDGDRVVWLSNRGTRISAIMNHLFSDNATKSNQFIVALSSPTYTDDKQLSFLSMPTANGEKENQVQPVVTPPSAVAPVYINITVGDKGHVISTGGAPVAATGAKTSEAFLFEKKIEDEIDFSNCKGFDEYFLEQRTPLPTISTKLKKKIAHFVENPSAYILKYYHYSSVQHAVRCMPVYSAINITGKRRYEELSGRSDNWFRDRRIDFDVQLTDDFYAHSNLDKGHMVRREDAEWGPNIEYADRAAKFTCSYANACPQVPDLNRAIFGYQGEWGQLEEKILELGVMEERGEEAKICVYNGPVFHPDDPVFKSIQIPMRYWKIIVWRNKVGDFKTTCFLLSQEDLMGDVDFEELHLDKVFKHRQCSISLIEKLTDLKFNGISQWDTFVSNNGGGEEESLIGPEELEKLIIGNSK